jgi:hypothetical protein
MAFAASCAQVGVGFHGDATPEPVTVAEAEQSRGEAEGPPKRIHLSTKLIMFSDADAAKVSSEHLPGWRPGEAGATGIIDTLDFPRLQKFLLFLRERKRSIMQAPQRIVLDREGATIDFEEEWRRGQAFHESIGGKIARGPGLKLGRASRLRVTPHVTGPENDIILTVVIGASKPEFAKNGMLEASGPVPRLPSTVSRISVSKVKMRDRATAVVACGRGELRGEKVNVLVMITPTVVGFEWKAGTGGNTRSVREEPGTKSSRKGAAPARRATPGR